MKTNEPTILVSTYFSQDDGVAVVHIDTPGIAENRGGPVIRIYLNDEPIEENPGYPGNPLKTPDNVYRKITEYIDSFKIANTFWHRWDRIAPDGYIPSDQYASAIRLLGDLEKIFIEEEESVV